MNRLVLLDELHQEVRACTRCRLSQTRTQAVPGVGPLTASILVVGEGPGEQEDLQGKPFVGRSGQLLTRELAAAGVERDQVFITNIVKCRPPQNRLPLVDEVAACNDWLNGQIALIEPKFIVTVGNLALQTLLGAHLRITQARSKVFRKEGILYVPILHPSAALRSTASMAMFVEDVKTLHAYLQRDIAPHEITDLGPRPAPSRAPQPALQALVEHAPQAAPLSLF